MNALPMRNIFLLIFASILIPEILFCQNTIGIPNIVNYSKQAYRAGSQNWKIGQDKNGIMYFANNNGLMSFDGSYWRTYPLPNKTIVRSLAIADDGRIYVGGQEEIGYFFPATNGELVFTSLKDLLPAKDNDFADVWNICFFNQKVYFRSNRNILEYDGKKIVMHKSMSWSYLGVTARGLMGHDYDHGLELYNHGHWQTVVKIGAFPPEVQVSGAVDIGKDSIMFTTLADGVFILHGDTLKKFSTPDIDALASQNIYGVLKLAAGKIAFITNLAGCVILNKAGKFIQRFSKQEGIQNNNVLSIMLDKDQNIWLGLDNGIDLLTYSNSIRNIFPDRDSRNAGYSSILYKNNLYLGLATGLYKLNTGGAKDLSYVNGTFDYIPHTQGQVWNLSEVNGQLFMGRNKGAYLINEGQLQLLDDKSGFWGFQLLHKQPAPVIIAGTYNGINIYNYNNGTVTNPNITARFESARFIVIDKDVIWAAHPYKGLYRIVFDAAGKPVASLYHDKHKILSSNHNKTFKIDGKILLTTDNGIFEFDRALNDFKHAVYYEQIFNGMPISYLNTDAANNIWFCSERRIGIVDRSGSKPRIIYIPEIDDKMTSGGFEHINVIDSNNVLIGAEKGFFHINYAQYKKSKAPLRVLIRMVQTSLQKDSILYGGYNNHTIIYTPSIAYKGNSIHVEFSAALYGQEQNTQYSYLLKGFDADWSPWQKRTEKDYTNLPAGNYTFQVKCRNNIDNESAIATFSFTILPPWYQTWWAYILYGLLVFFIMYLFYKRQQRKYRRQQQLRLQEQQRKYNEEQKQLQFQHDLEIEQNEKEIIRLKNAALQAEIEQKNLEDEQKRLQFQHQLEMEQNEKEIIHLQNEKLAYELEHKNTELASGAMNLVRKMEIFSKLKEDLNNVKLHVADEKGQKEFQKLIKVIDRELDHDQEWEQFEIHFDNVHTNYLKKLKEYCPGITASELKMAAYLRLSLSTKEIAQLMNISVRGVETGRYRLRKKLGLNAEVSLFDFLIDITK